MLWAFPTIPVYTMGVESKIILSLCDRSGNWPSGYLSADGYKVICLDYNPETDEGFDIRLLPFKPEWAGRVHGILAAPPCTHFANSGACWYKKKGKLPLLDGLSVVHAVEHLVHLYKPNWWVLENPVGRLTRYLGKYKVIVHPWQYGGYMAEGERTHPLYPAQDAYTKKTCLWGEGWVVPPQKPVPVIKVPPIVREDGSKSYHNPNNPHDMSFWMKPADRATFRSHTPLGFARAWRIANP